MSLYPAVNERISWRRKVLCFITLYSFPIHNSYLFRILKHLCHVFVWFWRLLCVLRLCFLFTFCMPLTFLIEARHVWYNFWGKYILCLEMSKNPAAPREKPPLDCLSSSLQKFCTVTEEDVSKLMSNTLFMVPQVSRSPTSLYSALILSLKVPTLTRHQLNVFDNIFPRRTNAHILFLLGSACLSPVFD